jgi:hypothetical protein
MRYQINILTQIYLATLLFVSFSCSKTKVQDSFVFPEIIDTLKTTDYYYSPTYLTIPLNLGYTIQKSCNKADLIDTTFDYEVFVNEDHSDTTNKSVKNRKGLSIYVDTTEVVSTIIYEWGIPPLISDFQNDLVHHSKGKTERSISKINYAERGDFWNASKFVVKGLPVYIFNSTKKSVRLKLQSGQIMMIQEALDLNGNWKPIELWQYAWCGRSYYDVILKPDYYLMTKIVKFKGAFETLLRLKLMNENEIIYSNPFKGSINLSQTDTSSYPYI